MEHGVVIGIVSARRDEDGLARVKVKIPVYGNTETDWARVAVPFGGKDHGMQWVPEEGDEVLVAFVPDDKSPIVIGSLYSKKRKPPSLEPDERVLKSKNGHTILISDKGGEERIEIRTNGGQKVSIDEGSGTIDVKAKQKVVVDAPSIELGGLGMGQSAVLGDTFLKLFNNHVHSLGTAVTGTVLPPIPDPVVLSRVTKLKG